MLPPTSKLPAPAVDPLAHYHSKRNFALTPEPRQGGESSAGKPLFVVQKHWARGLHYDLRLELAGTLKSWAVPKGPSLDPTIKRMAVQVEDHPLAYAGFEGTVPPQQYGAGRVIVWDHGTWSPQGDPLQGLLQGNLKFELHGHKLQGHWVLVRIKTRDEKQTPWLLIKEKDASARPSADYSVVDALPDSVIALTRAPRAPLHNTLPAESTVAPLPAKLSPQLATLAARPPAGAGGWLFEIKFDGYRMLARIDGQRTRLFTRNGHDWTAKLQPLQQALDGLALPSGWYDGEIVMPNADGVPDFGALQLAIENKQTQGLVYYLFDLPFCDGHDLRAAPLQARRGLLQSLLQQRLAARPSQQVRFSEEFNAAADDLLASACKLGLEGLIGKRRSAHYQSARSADWIKLKCKQRQAFVIGGYTRAQGARTGLGALLLGVFDASGALRHAGKVGTGFTEQDLLMLSRALKALDRHTSPFAGSPGSSAGVGARTSANRDGVSRWVEPTLVADVSFAEWTRAGRIRHAVFRGLRKDQKVGEIVQEKPSAVPAGKLSKTTSRTHKAAAAPPPPPRPPPPPTVFPSGLKISHPERVIDASSGSSKIDLLRYYGRVGDLMIKHLLGRPVSWLRAPTGIDGPLFFQKHSETQKLPGIHPLDPALNPGHPALITVASVQGLLWAAQWNVIEFHTPNCSAAAFEHPDRLVFDLDPGAGVAWQQVQEAAQLVRAFLSQLGLNSFLKTSGGKGLHVVVPLRRLHTWATVKGFSQAVVQHMAKAIPQRFVGRSGPRNRVGKIFIDALRNGLGATTVSAWSARARPGLGISVPVAWSELPVLRSGDHWTLKTVHERLATGNAPWQGYARAARGLDAAMSALGYVPAPVPAPVR